MKNVHVIAGVAENFVIGKDGLLPWSIPEDWRYFLDQTKGGVLIMGRKAFEEMVHLGEVRSDRSFIVVSRDKSLTQQGAARVASSLDEALAAARELPGTVWICGGQRIYEEGLARADRLYVTRVHAVVQGDTYFPDWREAFTELIAERPSQDEHYRYTFQVLARRGEPAA